MVWQRELDDIRRRRTLAAEMGGAEKVARHRSQGRLTVRERIALLLDDGSFEEVGGLTGRAEYSDEGELQSFRPANVVMGLGAIDGQRVVVCGDDFTVRGGAADAGVYGKQARAEELASSLRLPIVRLVDGTGGGGSVKMLEQNGFSYVPVNPGWDTIVDNLSVVPVVAACLGSVAGLGAARVAAAHFSVMVAGSAQLFVAGPPVVVAATRQEIDKEGLGGRAVHETSGAVDMVVGSEEEALALVRRFLSYLPSSAFRTPPVRPCDDPPDRRDERLLGLIPRRRRMAYKVDPLLESIFDRGSVLRLGRYGGSTVTALARLDGHPVGVVASDPMIGGGQMTSKGADALTRLVDLCSTFHLPFVSLTDQPGLAIGLDAERSGVIRQGVRAISAVYQATVPAAEVIVRRVFGVGGAGIVNRHRAMRRWSWPSGDWGSLPIEGGIEAAYRAELDAAPDRAARLAEITARLDAVRSPFRTAERFGVEDIIDPRDTRPVLCRWVRDAYQVLPERVGRPAFGTRP